MTIIAIKTRRKIAAKTPNLDNPDFLLVLSNAGPLFLSDGVEDRICLWEQLFVPISINRDFSVGYEEPWKEDSLLCLPLLCWQEILGTEHGGHTGWREVWPLRFRVCQQTATTYLRRYSGKHFWRKRFAIGSYQRNIIPCSWLQRLEIPDQLFFPLLPEKDSERPGKLSPLLDKKIPVLEKSVHVDWVDARRCALLGYGILVWNITRAWVFEVSWHWKWMYFCNCLWWGLRACCAVAMFWFACSHSTATGVLWCFSSCSGRNTFPER